MKNLFAYMDTLSEAINLLQLPFKFSTSYMLFGSFLTQVEFHKSKYASEKNALFDNINNYNQKYSELINNCRNLNSYKVLEDRSNTGFFKTFVLCYWKTIIPDSLKSKYSSSYWNRDLSLLKQFIHDEKIIDAYCDFIILWHDLYKEVEEKQSDLLDKLNVLWDNAVAKLDNIDQIMFGGQREYSFSRKFSPIMAEKMHTSLINGGFIDSGTSLDDFCAVFSLPHGRTSMKPIKWIKLNKGVKNKKINKSALIDLLTLLGYTQEEIIGKEGSKYKRLNSCFEIKNNSFKANDFSVQMKEGGNGQLLNVKSEYHEELENMLREIGFLCWL